MSGGNRNPLGNALLGAHVDVDVDDTGDGADVAMTVCFDVVYDKAKDVDEDV